jgi:flagellar basal-body rod modification protein FlgD
MTTTSSVTSGTSTGTTSTTSTNTAADQETRFLTLLTAQLKNQDPLNPMDNAQMTTQLAQISTVTGIEKLNNTITTMMSNATSSESLQAANLVGHSVMLNGSALTLTKSTAVGGFSLDKDASDVKVSILDKNGKEVSKLDLGAQKAGVNEFVWDGTASDGTTKLDDGNYTIKVTATNKDGSVGATALQLATVGGIVQTSDGSYKIDVGSLGRVSLSDIKLIL